MIKLAKSREALNRVNRNVNRRVNYRTDTDLYVKREFWAVADTEGDCEDYALSKYKELRAEGFLQTDFDFATCWVETGEYHAVLIAHTDNGDYVLDNRHTTIKKKDGLPYKWHMQSVGGRLKEWKLMAKGEADTTEAKSIRSVRNNNPGNIEKGDPWQGLSTAQPDDRFCSFLAPKWGFRAMARTLITYFDKHKRNTVAKVVNRWAPEGENDANAYISHVCRLTGFGRDQVLNLHSHAHLAPLVKAMAVHEGGGWFFKDKDLDEGLRLAGVEPPPKPLSESRTIRAAQVGTGGAIGVGAIAEAVDQLSPAVSMAQTMADNWPYIALGVLAITIGIMAWFRIKDWRESNR